MLMIKENQLLLGSVIYDTGNQYDSVHRVNEITIYKLCIDKDYIIINDHYYLYKKEDGYYYNSQYYFSESKANKVIKNYIEMQEKEN